jgi:hypothetical protein
MLDVPNDVTLTISACGHLPKLAISATQSMKKLLGAQRAGGAHGLFLMGHSRVFILSVLLITSRSPVLVILLRSTLRRVMRVVVSTTVIVRQSVGCEDAEKRFNVSSNTVTVIAGQVASAR